MEQQKQLIKNERKSNTPERVSVSFKKQIGHCIARSVYSLINQ